MVTLMIPSCMYRFVAIGAMENCICDILRWMTHHQLMNDPNTDFLFVGSRQQLRKVKIGHIHVGSSEIKSAFIDETKLEG